MRIRTVWGERKRYEGETPELMLAWTEDQIEENPRGFHDALEEERSNWGSDLIQERSLTIEIDSDKLLKIFETPVTEGEITS